MDLPDFLLSCLLLIWAVTIMAGLERLVSRKPRN